MKLFWGQLFFRSRYPFATLAGLSLAAAFPEPAIAGLAWVAPAFMLAAARGRFGADAFRIGYVAGLANWLASLYWLLLIPVTGYPILGWLALSAYLALYPAVWVWVCSVLSPESRAQSWFVRSAWAISGAAVWVGLEMVQARLLGGFPWNLVGASQFRLAPLIQIASMTGVYGVSFLVVWFALSLFSAALVILRRPTERYAWLSEMILPLAVLMMVFTFGFHRLGQDDTTGPTLRVTLIQPSIPQTMIWDPAENTNRFRQLLELSEQALVEPSDLLVWPEAALPEFNQSSFEAITNLIRTHHVWMIFGADDVVARPGAAPRNDYDYFNAAFLFDPAGQFMACYHKQQLVMFGEYVPLTRWLPFLKYVTPITGGFTPGDKPVPFELERRPPALREGTERVGSEASTPAAPAFHVRTATLICFEDMFPQLVREYVQDDTDFLVNLTNDGWFGEGAAQWQHAAGAVFRAVENRRPLVRCTNTGLTCRVDACGRIQQIFSDASGSVYGSGVMTAQIPVLAPSEKRARTFYNEHGDLFGWGCVILTAVLLSQRTIARKRL